MVFESNIYSNGAEKELPTELQPNSSKLVTICVANWIQILRLLTSFTKAYTIANFE